MSEGQRLAGRDAVTGNAVSHFAYSTVAGHDALVC
jgi:hypothetical protein